jgi:hypothetical protein
MSLRAFEKCWEYVNICCPSPVLVILDTDRKVILVIDEDDTRASIGMA